MIPDYAVLPKRSNEEKPHLPMPKKCPFLDMTSLYSEAGGAEESSSLLVNNPEARTLFDAQIAYRRGEIDKVYDRARYFLGAHSGFYAILGGGMLLALCAIWKGDIHLWNEACRRSWAEKYPAAFCTDTWKPVWGKRLLSVFCCPGYLPHEYCNALPQSAESDRVSEGQKYVH